MAEPPTPPKPVRRDALGLAIAVLAVSTAATLVRAAGEAPPLVIAAYRLTFGSLLFIVPALAGARSHGGIDRRGAAVAVLSGVFLAGHFASWIASLSYTSVASSLALVTAHPLVVALGSRALFGERVTRRVGWGIAIGLAGVAALAFVDRAEGGGASLSSGSNPLLGDALAFAGCLFVSGYFFCGRWARGRMSLVGYVAIAYSSAAALLVGVVLASGYRVGGYAAETVTAFVLLALVPQGIGHTLVNRSLRVFPTSIVSLAILGEVPLATALAWVLLGEAVPVARIGAVAVIVMAVAVAVGERWGRDARPVG